MEHGEHSGEESYRPDRCSRGMPKSAHGQPGAHREVAEEDRRWAAEAHFQSLLIPPVEGFGTLSQV